MGDPGSFEAHRKADPSARFTGWLRARTGERWSEATRHRFVEEMADGSIDPEVYASYLIQDHMFVVDLVDLFGHAIAKAPDLESKRPYIRFLGMVTSDENDHFERAFEAFDVPPARRHHADPGPATEAFAGLMGQASDGGYGDALSVLLPVEWVYLDWASHLADDPPGHPIIDEWIDLHANEGFERFVERMRTDLDRVGERAGPLQRERIADRFVRAVELEVAFWDQAYQLAGK